MRFLYIFPHPDDESFGVGHAMVRQRRQGHEVYLLTLTKGGATKQRFRLNYSVEEMGEIRHREMLQVEKVLNLSGMTVLDLPDSGLKKMSPQAIENVIESEIARIQPDVLISYPVHGISGFHDHLITHAVVKRVYVSMKENVAYLKRLAFITITEDNAKESPHFPLSHSTEEEIDCVLEVEQQDILACHRALDCYVTFQATIEKSGIKKAIREHVYFEFFQEAFDPPVRDLSHGL